MPMDGGTTGDLGTGNWPMVGSISLTCRKIGLMGLNSDATVINKLLAARQIILIVLFILFLFLIQQQS